MCALDIKVAIYIPPCRMFAFAKSITGESAYLIVPGRSLVKGRSRGEDGQILVGYPFTLHG